MQLENNISHLQETLADLRKQIIKSISAHSPIRSLALGPVLIYIEDSERKCLYNWSVVTWDELKLGPFIREITRAISDIAHFLNKNIDNYKIKDNNISLQEDIIKTSKDFLERDIGYAFDNFPLFHRDFKDFYKFINKTYDFV